MLEALTDLVNWINEGLYDFFVSAFSYVLVGIGIAMIKMFAFTMELFWDVGKNILELLSINTIMQSFLNNLNSEAVSFVAYLRGFDALMLVLNAKLTKYLMNMMGL